MSRECSRMPVLAIGISVAQVVRGNARRFRAARPLASFNRPRPFHPYVLEASPDDRDDVTAPARAGSELPHVRSAARLPENDHRRRTAGGTVGRLSVQRLLSEFRISSSHGATARGGYGPLTDASAGTSPGVGRCAPRTPRLAAGCDRAPTILMAARRYTEVRRSCLVAWCRDRYTPGYTG